MDIEAHESSSHSWFALYVQARHEKVVTTILTTKGFETCLPLNRQARLWGKRKQMVETPAFPGYVFCRFRVDHKTPIVSTPGVVYVVGTGKTLTPLEEHEVRALRTLERISPKVDPHPFLAAGQRVRVTSGPMEGLTGIMVQARNEFRIVVSLGLLQRSVSVEIDRDSVVAI